MQDGQTALVFAVAMGNFEIVRVLIASGADLNLICSVRVFV